MAKFSRLTKNSIKINTESGPEITNINNTNLNDSDAEIPTSNVVIAAMETYGFIPSGDIDELMISGTLENQQFCNYHPDLRGLTIYVKYSGNSYHKWLSYDDVSTTVWGSTEGTQTSTISYTENGYTVSATISAYCIPTTITFQSGDFNPEGVSKSEMATAFDTIIYNNGALRSTTSDESIGHRTILGIDNIKYGKYVDEVITSISVGNQAETPTGSSIYQYPGAESKTYAFFNQNSIYGTITVTASGKAQGLKCQYGNTAWGPYSSIGWRTSSSTQMVGYMENVNGRLMDSQFTETAGAWDSTQDWEVQNFSFTIDGSNTYRIVFGDVNSVKNVLDSKYTCSGGMSFTFTHAINSTGLWALQYNSGTPFNISTVLNSFDGDIIPANTDILFKYKWLFVTHTVSIIASSNYPGAQWMCESPSYSFSIQPYYHFKSSHGSGTIKNFASGTSLTYRDKNGISSTITGIQKISWSNNSVTVTYKNPTEHTLAISADDWFQSYTLNIVAYPTDSHGNIIT